MIISVIIPTYKPQKYLWECLKSLMAQTFPKKDFEIILVLNGCVEPYKSQIERYIDEKLKGMNVVFIHTEMGGVSNARNIGIEKARGEYMTFVDDDDVVSENYLGNLLEVSSPSCVSCANSYCFIEHIYEKKRNFITSAYERCKDSDFSLFRYRTFFSPPVAKLIHRNIIGDNRFPLDLKKSEDSIFCMRISTNVRDMKLAAADTIYYQRIREGSAMRNKQTIGEILKEHLYIELKYICEWCKRPFEYDFLFVLSRLFACAMNCCTYIKNNLWEEKRVL